MSLSIQSNSLFSFNRTLSNENIKHAIESSWLGISINTVRH
ncbi:hypothetical protein ArsFIN_42390 (plasmid) [Arsenophonus nasoniae]|uniref:Uncharacterized protein n=1 Tax=Arsenophonus nasoniae TaxID=638 RepID=A0A4P7L6H1_9GAMM|nr:hypothetical protein ArsFIN_42390 [Arsenophonus nasoniae]